MSLYKEIVLSCSSFMDAAENACHMLFLGMSIYLRGTYNVTSNREAGHGRYDIRIESLVPGRQHVLVEFKYGKVKDLKPLSEEALQQIHDRKYDTGLKGSVLCVGIAHSQKHCEASYQVHNV